MAKTEHYFIKFEPDCFYHVYNRSIDRKPLFKNDGNRIFFLKKYDKYLSSVLTTYSYALCGNHFHFGVKIHSIENLTTFKKLSNLGDRYSDPHELVRHQFQRMFQSYAMAFNKQQDRTGTLFERPFKRVDVPADENLIRLIAYHHKNPEYHRLCDDFRQSHWTSYSRYLLDHPSKLPKEEVFQLFGSNQKFIDYHDQVKRDLDNETDWFIEDDES